MKSRTISTVFGEFVIRIKNGYVREASFIEMDFDMHNPMNQQCLSVDEFWDEIRSYEILLQGTDFQKRIWFFIRKIEWGETLTYQEFTRSMGMGENYTRAVACAVSSNKIACLVPCHRIIPAKGGEGNYRWGNLRKKLLLHAES